MIAESLRSQVESNLLAILLSAIVLGSLAAARRYTNKHVVEPVKAIPQLQADVLALKGDVAAIHAEVHVNHGTSLRDSTNRNEVLTRALAERVGVDPDTLVPPMPPVEREPTPNR